MHIRPFAEADRADLIALWQACALLRPWNDPQADIDRKLRQQADGLLIAERDGQLIGSVMTGYDGHRGWVNYLAVAPDCRWQGVGRALMNAAEHWLRQQGCAKLNLQLRQGNHDAASFYEQIGFVRDALDSYGKRLIVDGPQPPRGGPLRQLVLASRNPGKARELSALLAPLGWELLPITAFSDVEPDESAPSFIENALIKARHAAKVSGLPALADDSGLEVQALNGAPGVLSARYAGPAHDDAANNRKLLEAMADVPDDQRGARFVATLALLRHPSDPCPLLAEGYWAGSILRAPRGSEGFGYDPLFYLAEFGKSAAELPPALKTRIGHRARAMRALLARL